MLEQLRQKHREFKSSLGYSVRLNNHHKISVAEPDGTVTMSLPILCFGRHMSRQIPQGLVGWVLGTLGQKGPDNKLTDGATLSVSYIRVTHEIKGLPQVQTS